MSKTLKKLANLRNLVSCTTQRCQVQYDFMKNDHCIVVDQFDHALSNATKETCHFKEGLLHRAFSLFLFRQIPNCSGLELLIQQRSSLKLTYPLLWANTCCSHPCTNYAGEAEQYDAIGVRRAAQRRVKQELGIDSSSELPLENIHFLTRIKYFANNEPVANDWCEHEIDYILVSIITDYVKTDRFTCLNVNSNEVAKVKWVKENSINTSFVNEPYIYTPWFRNIIRIGLLHRLFNWASAKATNSSSFYALNQVFNRNSILEFD